MTEFKDRTRGRDLLSELCKFTTLRYLGQAAANEYAPQDDLLAPEGKSFSFYPTNREDNLTIYMQQTAGDGAGAWVGLELDASDTHPDVLLCNGERLSFLGDRITYDREERKVFVYSKSGNTRLEYSDGISLGEIVETPQKHPVRLTLVHTE